MHKVYNSNTPTVYMCALELITFLCVCIYSGLIGNNYYTCIYKYVYMKYRGWCP